MSVTQWEALTVLLEGHEKGLAKLALLEGVVEKLKRGRVADALPRLHEVLEFFNGELRAHFLHEEDGLFPVLASVIGRMGPVEAMKEEHQSIWRTVGALEERIAELEQDSAGTLEEIERGATHVLGLLRSHIQKENEMLFPLAEHRLSDRDKQEVVHRIKAAMANIRVK